MMTPAELQSLGISIPPSQEELPYSDGDKMESERHKLQMDLLIDGLRPWLEQRDDGYVGGDMFIYFSMAQVKTQDFRGPDVFVVLGVPKGERKSWVCWEENKSPDVVIELLSARTAAIDKGEKKQIYQDRLRVSEYFWYDPFNPEDWAGFSLVGGGYQAIAPTADNALISDTLGLTLVRWQGTYQSVTTTWLRWAERNGTLLPTATELAEQEKLRAEQEKLRAEQEKLRAEQEKLRAEQEKLRAEQAEQRADQAEQRAEQERLRAEAATAQVLHIAQTLIRTGMDLEQVAQVTGVAIATLKTLRLD